MNWRVKAISESFGEVFFLRPLFWPQATVVKLSVVSTIVPLLEIAAFSEAQDSSYLKNGPLLRI